MADYYPLIAKAVGLEKSADARRALYDRARTALLAQLRGVEPALSEPDITRERLALEEAIRKVEAEAARRSRGEPLPARPESRQEQDPRADGATDTPQEASPSPPRYDLRASRAAVAAPAGDGDDQSDVEEARQAVPLSAAAARPAVEARQLEESRIHTLRTPAAGGEARRAERTLLGRSRPSVPERAPRSVQDDSGETDGLESASADGARNVRARQATRPPDLERLQPRPGSRGEARGEQPMESAPEQPLPRRSSRDSSRSPAPVEREADEHGRVQAFPRVIRAERAPESAAERPVTSSRTSNRIVALAVMVLLALTIAGIAYWWGQDIIASIRGASNATRTTEQTEPAEGARGKINERAPSAADTNEGALLATKVVLYEEDQTNPNGTQFVGTAAWRTERVAPSPGETPDLVVRAEIEIPEQKVSARLSLRRNDDKQLPASHTVEVVFTLPPDFAHGSIANIPGILMKQGETTRGVPLNGVAVKVTDNFFLIGLSSVDVDMQRNIQLLKERSWFDIPLVYGDGKRAIVAVEKGTPGERAFTEAFATWGQ